ncbi:MAG: sel1 repeat family protein [Clostridia bacterium]|nr:sel1 repeat family protein [Clostridia bacterium]
MQNKISLSAAYMQAISFRDSEHINNKGADLYVSEEYDKAVEYYRIASAMGDTHAASNLGYCYLYGRGIEPNTSLAVAYFIIAAQRGDIDAAYKLGDIYSSDKWGLKDKELSVYYYDMAAHFITSNRDEDILWITQFQNYPSLCFALGREMSLNGSMPADIETAYIFLKHGEKGYIRELANGSRMYEQPYKSLLEWLADPQFDPIRDKYDKLFDEEYYDDCENILDDSILYDGIN